MDIDQRSFGTRDARNDVNIWYTRSPLTTARLPSCSTPPPINTVKENAEFQRIYDIMKTYCHLLGLGVHDQGHDEAYEKPSK